MTQGIPQESVGSYLLEEKIEGKRVVSGIRIELGVCVGNLLDKDPEVSRDLTIDEAKVLMKSIQNNLKFIEQNPSVRLKNDIGK